MGDRRHRDWERSGETGDRQGDGRQAGRHETVRQGDSDMDSKNIFVLLLRAKQRNFLPSGNSASKHFMGKVPRKFSKLILSGLALALFTWPAATTLALSPYRFVSRLYATARVNVRHREEKKVCFLGHFHCKNCLLSITFSSFFL